MVRSWVAFHNTPIFARINLAVLATMVYAWAVVFLERNLWPEIQTVGVGFHSFFGLILGVLLVFRTNTSYDRWWEGRKLWGQLINDSRNLAIKVQTCVQAPEADKLRLGQWLIDFAIALKDHLRGGARLQNLPGFEQTTDRPVHVPAYVSARIYGQLEQWRRAEQLGGFELLFLDSHAASLMQICGACERVQKSPISVSYRWFIRQSIAIYLLTLPWAILDNFVYWSIPAEAMLAYFMIGLEMIAEDIEDPFGMSQDDLKLDDYCQTIRASVHEILLTGRAQ
jgi:putative membrane protein